MFPVTANCKMYVPDNEVVDDRKNCPCIGDSDVNTEIAGLAVTAVVIVPFKVKIGVTENAVVGIQGRLYLKIKSEELWPWYLIESKNTCDGILVKLMVLQQAVVTWTLDSRISSNELSRSLEVSEEQYTVYASSACRFLNVNNSTRG